MTTNPPHPLTDQSHDLVFAPAVLEWVEDNPGTVLFERNSSRRGGGEGRLFLNPKKIITVRSYEEVLPALEELQQAVAAGLYAAGFIAYEAGYAFESVLPRDRLPDTPLLWFGLYDRPRTVSKGKNGRRKPAGRRDDPWSLQPPKLLPALSGERYAEAVGRILQLISDGDTYQVNLTFPLRMSLPGPAYRWYDFFRRTQRVAYSSFLNTGAVSILSLSPELFFRRENAKLVLRPMKGTAQRGRTLEEDKKQVAWLKESEKNRAENLMIVDLLRNDVGRIALPGGVRVRTFFEIERYETVFQATSTIEARLRRDITIPDIIRALFPSGSVTGAPKIRTMQIIRELEEVPRGVYTGSIGYFGPDRTAEFNVAIRTIVVSRNTGNAVMGVGSGVVHDSDPTAEYRECLLKARFVTERPEEFQLLETLRWDPGKGFFLMPFHMRRLKESASYFGFQCDKWYIRDVLEQARKSLAKKKHPMRIRLLMHRNGHLEVETKVLRPLPAVPAVRVSE
ncbi:MAG: aminodeoxychorismate synthase component I, partial [Ignavibacteriales bacterium]|nr:aminodeoxychorismate synthase component I [Ignavibacteriales bacterium]